MKNNGKQTIHKGGFWVKKPSKNKVMNAEINFRFTNQMTNALKY